MAVAMKISADAFKNMAFDSGMWLSTFDVSNPATPSDSDIICTTTGDISFNVTADTVDMADDVNNLHGKFKEYQKLTGWNVEASFTALECTPDVLAMGFGAADISGNKIAPRNDFKLTDFKDRYWVGKTLGDNLVVVHLMNTISTGGIQFTTTKDGKGTLGITLTAFASTANQDTVPIEFYVIQTPSIVLSDHVASVTVGGASKVLTATTYPAGTTVTWASDDNTKATVTNGTVAPVAAGTVTITASITVSGTTYKDKCVVTVNSAGA